MHFASVREFRTGVSSVLRRSGDETVIVTLRGKPVGLFLTVSEPDLEEMLQAVKAARLRRAVDRVRESAKRAGSDRLSPGEIEAEIQAVRRSKRA